MGRFCQSGGEQLSLSAPRKHATFLVLRGESAVWAISARFPGGPVQEESPNVSISPWPKPPLGVAGSQGLSFAQEGALCLPPPCSTASPRVTYCRTSLPRLCNEGFGSCRDLSAVWILLACWNSPASHHFVLTRGGLGCLPPELTSSWLFRPVICSGGWAHLPQIHLLCKTDVAGSPDVLPWSLATLLKSVLRISLLWHRPPCCCCRHHGQSLEKPLSQKLLELGLWPVVW